MKAWMLAAISGAPEKVVQTFTSNTTWTATGVNLLTSVVGKGQDGTPMGGPYFYADVTTTVSKNGNIISQTSSTEGPVNGVAPDDYCQGSMSSDGTLTETCYVYTQFPGDPAVTGANTTAFSLTFPGGAGVPATPVTYNDVLVTPNAPYSFVIPAGGSVTITYYK